ncbi:MAG TPA: ATP-binding protein [Acidimicrobiales bacterium]|nr:ATP-binding protein [Acidimicrobiales bacterium]
MSRLHRISRPNRWRLPRRTARLRLTALCGGLFLMSGTALVAITYALFERATALTRPALPKVPHTPAVQLSQTLPDLGEVQRDLALAVPRFVDAPYQLYKVDGVIAGVSHQLEVPGLAKSQRQVNLLQLTRDQHKLAQAAPRLVQIQRQLTAGQHQIAAAVQQVAQAVHQVAQAGSVEAAQRATDSHQLLVNSGIALAMVAVLALLAGWLVAGRMLRPIRVITRTARRISSTSLHERLALAGPEDELKELGDTLDDLFGRLDAAFEAQSHFVANASHELRTPLTAERALLQVALDDPEMTVEAWRATAREVLASSQEQARLIEALLTLASSESGLKGEEPVDLAAAVIGAAADIQPEVARMGIHMGQVTASATLEGDRLLIERLVANLLTNAVRHNVVGGRVEVVTATTDGKAEVTVTNTGPVVSASDVDRLFQPFQRLDRRRGHYKDGHGLGLSIVRAIATAHGATINATPVAGGGLSVNVVFPRAATEPRPAARSTQTDEHREVELALH